MPCMLAGGNRTGIPSHRRHWQIFRHTERQSQQNKDAIPSQALAKTSPYGAAVTKTPVGWSGIDDSRLSAKAAFALLLRARPVAHPLFVGRHHCRRDLFEPGRALLLLQLPLELELGCLSERLPPERDVHGQRQDFLPAHLATLGHEEVIFGALGLRVGLRLSSSNPKGSSPVARGHSLERPSKLGRSKKPHLHCQGTGLEVEQERYGPPLHDVLPHQQVGVLQERCLQVMREQRAGCQSTGRDQHRRVERCQREHPAALTKAGATRPQKQTHTRTHSGAETPAQLTTHWMVVTLTGLLWYLRGT